jgi:hypothetical protein
MDERSFLLTNNSQWSVICVAIYKEENETRGQPEARAQVEGPQVKCICIKGLKISPQPTF